MPGFPGGNFKEALKQVQKAQELMAKKQEELGAMRVEASAGGGMVTIVANGKEEILNIKIDKSVVNPEDIEMLEDLILAALKEAQQKAKELIQKEMSGLMGSLGLPHIPGL